ncbi:MAG: methionyl-tRNA formyltransferase [Muribaculaceae bacterium]|nr:methionyl-tRNA formyltransferase [Muribaculaceae bacterium]
MDKQSLRIVFLGTPDFAVESLDKLYKGGYNIVGVITMPDKIGGRGHKIIESPVKQYAINHSIPVLQPTNLKDEEFISALKSLNADLQIVIAFRMLPEVVWSMPRLGTFNLHASLLPKYRGAAPINRAVMNGEKETGVTTFFLKHEIDTGDVIQQVAVPISLTDNVEIIHDKLMNLGAKLVIETVDAIINNSVVSISQDKMLTNGCEPTPAPKIFKEDCRINWNDTTMAVYNHIRGLSPYPAAWSSFVDGEGNETQFKIFETSLPQLSNEQMAGMVFADKHKMQISCSDGKLEILSLQLAGKKRMTADEFLRGFDATDKNCK